MIAYAVKQTATFSKLVYADEDHFVRMSLDQVQDCLAGICSRWKVIPAPHAWRLSFMMPATLKTVTMTASTGATSLVQGGLVQGGSGKDTAGEQSLSPWMGICVIDVKLVNWRPCQDLITEHALCKVCLPSEIPSVQDPPKGALKQKHEGSLQS